MKSGNEKFIKFFKALANEERIEIIKLLKKNGEMFAQDIENHFYLEQSTTSHHLNMLKRAGVAQSRKEGRKVYYSLDPNSVSYILELFKDLIL